MSDLSRVEDLAQRVADGLADVAMIAELEALMREDASARIIYLQTLQLHQDLDRKAARDTLSEEPVLVELPTDLPVTSSRRWGPAFVIMASSAALIVAVAAFFAFRQVPCDAVLTERAGADFAEPASPLPIGEGLQNGQDYALRSGMIKMEFGCGAAVIVEGPAVFRVAGPMELEANMGSYSVDVPAGAVGFRVTSPAAQVKDLGTRFSVHISETGETDVQVVEGKTEIIRSGNVVSELTTGEARRIDTAQDVALERIDFEPERYVSHLPDRVVSYEVVEHEDHSQELISVKVQRGVRHYTYSFGDLIGIQLIHFKAGDNWNNLAVPGKYVQPAPPLSPAARRGLLDGDAYVNTGVINPGGSQQPLIADPVMNQVDLPEEPNTPGMAVRFVQPVINGPGPDIVLFDVNSTIVSPQGDYFHVAPLQFRDGLHAHTVTSYNIDIRASEAVPAAPFHLHAFAERVGTLSALESTSYRSRTTSGETFKILAVGIDLSWLGYESGAAVEGLFIQDAADDRYYVDPTLIGGLPAPQ